jgi:hypothetical protein
MGVAPTATAEHTGPAATGQGSLFDGAICSRRESECAAAGSEELVNRASLRSPAVKFGPVPDLAQVCELYIPIDVV